MGDDEPKPALLRIRTLAALHPSRPVEERTRGSKSIGEQNRPELRPWKVQGPYRRSIMPTQYENPQTVKLEDEIISEASTTKRIDHVAEKAAEKSSKIAQQFDKENSTIFSK
jgi:hypothetical protein